jgi:3-methyladenine DNA glycosylase/8-oxoguanine DNA glycosylase
LTAAGAVSPRGPYSLALSARLAGDATRTFRDGLLRAVVSEDEVAEAWQLPDGRVCIRAASDEGVERMRWLLALDDDHSEFLRQVRDDPLLGRASLELRGLRPLRTATVAQALLRAFCGQLIESRRARSLERRIVRALTPEVADGLHAAPTAAGLASMSPAELRALGLHARRAAALVRICSTLELERLHNVPTAAVAARLERERGLGPWSVGVVCLEGLGRFDYGLVGDLGFVKLLRAWRGRPVEGWETAELLAPYGRWAGIASVYLLAALGRGHLPATEPLRAAA